MKKSVLVILLLLAGMPVWAQDPAKIPSEALQVPSMVTDKFNNEYPGISGSWSKDGENYRVEFTDPKSRMGHVIIYDKTGTVIRRESELDRMSSPGAMNEYLNKNFPGEDFKTWVTEDSKGERSYYANRKDGPVRFDQNGNYIAPADKASAPQKDKKSKAR